MQFTKTVIFTVKLRAHRLYHLWSHPFMDSRLSIQFYISQALNA